MTGGSIDYDRWYPEVPPVMDTKMLADLLHTNEQIIRAWVREGLIPTHRKPGGRKFTFFTPRGLRLADQQSIRAREQGQIGHVAGHRVTDFGYKDSELGPGAKGPDQPSCIP